MGQVGWVCIIAALAANVVAYVVQRYRANVFLL